MDEHWGPMAEAGFIKRCANPRMVHEPVVAAKKDAVTGEWTDKRCCVDYGAGTGGINAYTPKDSFQLPLAEELYDRICQGGCKYVSLADCKSGFNSTWLDESVQDLACFWWNNEVWAPTRNMFGMTNMPQYFQRVMQGVLMHAGITANAVVFIDDVLLFTETYEQHCEVLRKFFAALQEFGLRLHPGKSRFFYDVIEYLGHNLSAGGQSPTDAKVAAIRALPTPCNVHDLRRVLGFAGYYRCYAPFFSEMAAPLNNLLKKDVPWKWSPECEQAWQQIKDSLCRPGNILRPPDRHRPFIVHTDWSQKGLSAVLGQQDDDGNEYLVACISRSCNVHEANFGSYKGEMLAATWGIRSFRHYLLGSQYPFVLFTDHKGLQWLMTSKELVGQYARWAVMLSPYCFTIHHKPGVTHTVADVPSRFPQKTSADTTGTREDYDEQAAPYAAVHETQAVCPVSEETHAAFIKRYQPHAEGESHLGVACMVSDQEQQQEPSPAVRSVHSVLADFPVDVAASFPVTVAAPMCAQSAYMPDLQSLPEDLSALCSLSAHVPDFLGVHPHPRGGRH